jgi:hypothetical protein
VECSLPVSAVGFWDGLAHSDLLPRGSVSLQSFFSALRFVLKGLVLARQVLCYFSHTSSPSSQP